MARSIQVSVDPSWGADQSVTIFSPVGVTLRPAKRRAVKRVDCVMCGESYPPRGMATEVRCLTCEKELQERMGALEMVLNER